MMMFFCSSSESASWKPMNSMFEHPTYPARSSWSLPFIALFSVMSPSRIAPFGLIPKWDATPDTSSERDSIASSVRPPFWTVL